MERIRAVIAREEKIEKRCNEVFTVKNSSCKGDGRLTSLQGEEDNCD